MSKKVTKRVWAVLKPRLLDNGGYVVSLGMVNGKNLRRKFKEYSDATDFCNNERANRKVDKTMPDGADGLDVRAWMELDAEMRKVGAGSLLAAGRRRVKDFKAVTQTGSARECLNAVIEKLTSEKLRGTYKSDMRNRCGRFLRFFCENNPNRPAIEITSEVIEAYSKTLKNKGDLKTISAWLYWAVKDRWLPKNPCQGLLPEPAHGNVVTLSTAESVRMLAAAVHAEDWEVLATVAISLFAGLRPNEFRKRAKGDTPVDLVWEDFTDEHLSVRPELCKNGRRSGQGRVIDLEPVLKEWIEFIRLKKGGVLTGSIQPKNWTKQWLAWRKKHWIDSKGKPIPWAKDQLRHSFGSYHLARSRDLGVTSFIMENSPKILKKHYWNWQTLGTQAAIYWDLSPSKVLEIKVEESRLPVSSN